MNIETRTKLLAQIVRHEGFQQSPYMDCCSQSRLHCTCATPGFLTVGVGHNLDHRPLSKNVVMILLDEDVNDIEQLCQRRIVNWNDIDETRQAALIEMAFNGALFNSPLALGHLARLDYAAFAQEMLNGPWKAQVGQRATVLAKQASEGTWTA